LTHLNRKINCNKIYITPTVHKRNFLSRFALTLCELTLLNPQLKHSRSLPQTASNLYSRGNNYLSPRKYQIKLKQLSKLIISEQSMRTTDIIAPENLRVRQQECRACSAGLHKTHTKCVSLLRRCRVRAMWTARFEFPRCACNGRVKGGNQSAVSYAIGWRAESRGVIRQREKLGEEGSLSYNSRQACCWTRDRVSVRHRHCHSTV
jgi:hypothetical protein